MRHTLTNHQIPMLKSVVRKQGPPNSVTSIKTRATLVVVIGTILGLGLSLGGGLMAERENLSPDELAADQAKLLAEVMERVKRDYVEPIDDAMLLESAIRGMVGDLDPHSEFLDANEYQDIRASTSGRYSGVGLEVSSADGIVQVIAPIDGTPAQKAGVRSGDEIVEIDGVVVESSGLDDTIGKLRGRAGTAVEIRVRRENYDDPLTFHLTRQKIQVASVRHEILEQSVAYLRLSQFNDTTADEVRRAIDAMMQDAQEQTGNMLTGMVLDLRNNPGGILDSAVDISDLFLDEGVIVSAVGRTPESQFTRMAHDGDILDGAAIAVLVNRGSASASEIVAGALQDHERATIVGTRTFGKGLVQTVMPLSKGRAIKLTTSHYYTPSGDSINKTGVQPDVLVEGSRDHPNQSLTSMLDREGDAQLIEALAILRNRPVLHSRAPN
jgi:carboxyl-terminal processing protease